MLGLPNANTTRKESSMSELDRVKRTAEIIDMAFGLAPTTAPRCDRCGPPGAYRGGRCYGCIRLTQELERIHNSVAQVRQNIAPGMEEHCKGALLKIEQQLANLEDGIAND